MSTDDPTNGPTPGRTPTEHPPVEPYEIRVRGHLGPRWMAWFDGLDLSNEDDGTTVISGPIVDQAALHGVLQRVRDLGLPLVSVTRVDASPTKTTGSDAG